jgi:hypothetical protein
MKVAGIRMTDPWASRVLRSKGVETERVAGVPVETVVQMERVSFEHHGSEKNYRPLLHLTGELRSILPNESLPFGVDEVTFRSGLGPTVDAFYEFDDSQLTELVSKGYFTEGFEPPANMAGIPWELPTTIDALILAPEQEGDAPVVFVTIHGQTELALDAENSGYDLAEYFEDKLTPEAQQEKALHSAQQGVPVRGGEINDLFAGEDFRAADPARLSDTARRLQGSGQLRPSGEFPVVRDSIFEDLMAEFEERHNAEAAELAAQAGYDPDSVEGVYHQRIAPGVSKALTLSEQDTISPEATGREEAAAVSTDAEEGLLDLDAADEELDVVPVATTPVAEEAQEQPTGPVAGSNKTGQQNRRVQRTLEHEKALELDRVPAESGPELG